VRDSKPAARLFLGFWLIYLAFLAPGIYSVDGNSMLGVAESIVTHHGFVVAAILGHPGLGGRIYSVHYPLLSVITIPLAWVALLLSPVVHLPFHYLAAVLALLWPGALTAATAGVVALLTLRLGGTWRGAWLAALAFGFGTVALAYARTFFAEPLLAFLVASSLYLTIGRTRKDIGLASLCAALAILAKPPGVMIGPILTAYLAAKRVPISQSVQPSVGTGLGFILYAGYNVLRFGNPLNFGQSYGFGLGNVFSAILGFLVSPGYGLVWYCPPVILAIFGFRAAVRKQFLEALMIVTVFVAFLSLHSLVPYWFSGWSWGPRYLVPAVPGLCALAGLVEGNLRKIFVVLILLGFLINAPTMFSFSERYDAELSERGISADSGEIVWSFRHAPFLNQWPAAIRETRDAMGVDVREIFQQRGAPSDTIESSRALRVVAVWWWVLPLAHISRWIGMIAALLMTALGGVLIFGARSDDTLPQLGG